MREAPAERIPWAIAEPGHCEADLMLGAALLIPALRALEAAPGVAQVGLRGDHLHAITVAGAHDAASLQGALGPYGAAAVVEPGEPTLEDVFTALTHAHET
jgi:hypothetical protein